VGHVCSACLRALTRRIGGCRYKKLAVQGRVLAAVLAEGACLKEELGLLEGSRELWEEAAAACRGELALLGLPEMQVWPSVLVLCFLSGTAALLRVWCTSECRAAPCCRRLVLQWRVLRCTPLCCDVCCARAARRCRPPHVPSHVERAATPSPPCAVVPSTFPCHRSAGACCADSGMGVAAATMVTPLACKWERGS
jgi:hypothetical protein